MQYSVTNPATGEVEKTYETATDNEIADVIDRSAAASKSWRDTPIAERREIINRVADLNAERAKELGAIITREMGKTTAEADGEMGVVVDIYRYYADNAEELLADQPLHSETGGKAVVRRSAGGPGLRDHAVELPLLPGGPLRRAQPDGGQHRHPQARSAVPRVGAGDREDLPGGGPSGRRVHQRLRHQRAGGHHRRPTHASPASR